MRSFRDHTPSRPGTLPLLLALAGLLLSPGGSGGSQAGAATVSEPIASAPASHPPAWATNRAEQRPATPASSAKPPAASSGLDGRATPGGIRPIGTPDQPRRRSLL